MKIDEKLISILEIISIKGDCFINTFTKINNSLSKNQYIKNNKKNIVNKSRVSNIELIIGGLDEI